MATILFNKIYPGGTAVKNITVGSTEVKFVIGGDKKLYYDTQESVIYDKPVLKLSYPNETVSATGGTISPISKSFTQTWRKIGYSGNVYEQASITSGTIKFSISGEGASINENTGIVTWENRKTTVGEIRQAKVTMTVISNGKTDSITAVVKQQANVRTLSSVYIVPYKPDDTWIVNVSNGNWSTCPASGGYVKCYGYANYTHTSGEPLNDQYITNNATLTWSTGKGSWITDHINGGYQIHSRSTTPGEARSSSATWTYGGKTSASKTLTQQKNEIIKTNYGNWLYNWTTSGNSTRTRNVVYTYTSTATANGSNQTETGGTRYIVFDSYSDNKGEYIARTFTRTGGSITCRTVSHDYWGDTMITSNIITGVSVSCSGFSCTVSGYIVTITASSLTNIVSLGKASANLVGTKTGFTSRTAGTFSQEANKIKSVTLSINAGQLNSASYVATGESKSVSNKTAASCTQGTAILQSGSATITISSYGYISNPSYTWKVDSGVATLTSSNNASITVSIGNNTSTSDRSSVIRRTASFTGSIYANYSASGATIPLSGSNYTIVTVTQAKNSYYITITLTERPVSTIYLYLSLITKPPYYSSGTLYKIDSSTPNYRIQIPNGSSLGGVIQNYSGTAGTLTGSYPQVYIVQRWYDPSYGGGSSSEKTGPIASFDWSPNTNISVSARPAYNR